MAEDIKLMLSKIRPYNEETDSNLEKFSHSKLECFDHCPRNFMLKYRYNNYLGIDSVATAVGSIVHKVLELKGICKMEKKEVDYEYLKEVLMNGYKDNEESLIGINKIKIEFRDEWEEFDTKSLLTYDEKIEVFLDSVLTNEMEDEEWEVIGTEVPFSFVYDNKYVIRGFCDRIDAKRDNDGNIIDIKCVDYKSSKTVFQRSKIVSSQQFGIYSMAIYLMYGMLPSEHEYSFVLIDEKQSNKDGVCTSGYIKRILKKIDKLFESIEEMDSTGCFKPNANQLCHWCDFCEHSVNGQEPYNTYCDYYSLWTPYNRTFAVNKEYSPEDDMEI